MATRRKKRKQAEETLVDIVEVRDSARDYFEENKGLITAVIVGLIIIVGGFILFRQFYKMPKEQEASEQMAQAQFQFERDSFALALTNPGNNFMGLADIAEEYSGTAAGNTALYYAGVSYLNLGQYEAAIDYLNDFSPAGEIGPIMKFGALGDAYGELNDFDRALSNYEKAVKRSDNNLLSSYYLKKIGMLNEKLGNTEAAREAYQTIKDEYFDSPYASDIEKYLARVAG